MIKKTSIDLSSKYGRSMDTLYKSLTEKKWTDLQLVLDDGSNKITMDVHKVLLVEHIPYFEKLLVYNNEAIIVLHVANSYAAYDLILSVYGQNVNSGNLPKWYHLLNIAKCRDYFGLEALKYDIPEEIDTADYDFILELCSIVGFDETNLRILSDNLPLDYDLTKLSTDFAKEVVKNKVSYTAIIKNNNKITLWDILTNEVIKIFELKTSASHYEVSGNGEFLLVRYDEGCDIYNTSNPNLKYSFDVCHRHTLSTDHSIVAMVNSDSVVVFDLIKGCNIARKSLRDLSSCIIFVPFSMKIIIVDTFSVRIWNIETDNTVKLCDYKCSNILFCKNSKYIELIDGRSGINMHNKIWDISSDNPFEIYKDLTIRDTSFKDNRSVTWPETINYVLFHVADQIEIHDIDTKKIIYRFNYESCLCTFSDNNEYLLIVAGEDEFYTKIINLKTAEKCFRSDTRADYYISPNSKFLAEDYENNVKIWDLNTEKMLHSIDVERSGLLIMFSPNDRYLIISNNNNANVLVFDIFNGKLVNKIQKNIDVFCLKPHYNDLCQRLLEEKIE